MITIFIEDLYYDNVMVQELNFSGDKEYKKNAAIMCEAEKYLTEHLKGKFRSSFSQFSDVWSCINNETNKKFFIEGFKLGARCIIEVMEN